MITAIVLGFFATVAVFAALYSWAKVCQEFAGNGLRGVSLYLAGIVLTVVGIYSSLN